MWENHSFLKNEMAEFETYIQGKFPAGKAYMDDLSREAMFSGGKRIRPALTVISAMPGTYDRGKVFPVAAAIEALHTATLIHDDIIDNADMRRGKPTVAQKHGTNIAVYTGDYLLATSVLLLAESGLPLDLSARVAKAAKMICVGEVNQYLSRYNVAGVASYIRRVMKKTGILFAASCSSGSYIAGADEKQMNLMARLGLNLGVAFQIRDDLLDIQSDVKKEGKPTGKDLSEGIATLPFIYGALKDKRVGEKIEAYYKGLVGIKDVVAAVRETGGVESALKLKMRYVRRCYDLIDQLVYKESMAPMVEILQWL